MSVPIPNGVNSPSYRKDKDFNSMWTTLFKSTVTNGDTWDFFKSLIICPREEYRSADDNYCDC